MLIHKTGLFGIYVPRTVQPVELRHVTLGEKIRSFPKRMLVKMRNNEKHHSKGPVIAT